MSYAYINDLALPEGATTWNARAIISHGYVDILPDRQSTEGNPQRVKTLLDRLNQGALRQAREVAQELMRSGKMTQASDEVFTLYSDVRFEVKATPNASYGYLYICAYDKSEVTA